MAYSKLQLRQKIFARGTSHPSRNPEVVIGHKIPYAHHITTSGENVRQSQMELFEKEERMHGKEGP